ncbi:VanZ family protein [Clostridium sporogenes]|uniref:VanZ family protein n=1 Tax=Clostridium sporogenes TaxID=1509 RepID=UPI0035B63CD9
MVKVTLILCFFTLLFIECFQYVATYWENVRIVDINDTKLDTLSGVFGHIFYYEILKKVTTLLLEY